MLLPDTEKVKRSALCADELNSTGSDQGGQQGFPYFLHFPALKEVLVLHNWSARCMDHLGECRHDSGCTCFLRNDETIILGDPPPPQWANWALNSSDMSQKVVSKFLASWRGKKWGDVNWQ